MTEPHDPSPAPDAPLGPTEVDALRALLAVTEAPDDIRSRHLASAMAAFDDADPTTADPTADPTMPVPIARARRRRGGALPWAAAAAVLLLVAVVGVQVVGDGASRQDSATDSMAAMPESAQDDSGAGGAMPGESADEGAVGESTEQTTAADAPASDSADGFDATARNAAPPVDLGEVPDDAALLAAATANRDRATPSTLAPATTLPTTGSVDKDAAELAPQAGTVTAACDTVVAALGLPRYTAIVGGRPVVAAFADGGELVIVALDDCTVRSS